MNQTIAYLPGLSPVENKELCARFKRFRERIVLDIDATDVAVHGGQQLALFNAHHDNYCFQPIHIFEAASAKPVLSLLRPASGLPGKRRRASSSVSCAASGTTGRTSGSPCAAMAITPRPRS